MKAYLKRFAEALLMAVVMTIVFWLGGYCLTAMVEKFGYIDVAQLNPMVCYSIFAVLLCAVVAMRQS